MPSKYPIEFRQRAVHWLQETVPGSESEYAAIRHVASRLGISTETLRRWNLAVQVDAKTADASCRSASSDNRCFYS
jgi:transposase